MAIRQIPVLWFGSTNPNNAIEYGVGGNSGGGPTTGPSTLGVATVATNPDGSRSMTITSTIPTESPGVTKEVSLLMNFDAEGNLLSRFETTTYKKKDGGTVSISTITIGNYSDVYYTETDADGSLVRDGAIRGILLIGLRGWGSGLETTGITNGKTLTVVEGEKKDSYDDMIILANLYGDIAAFHNVNFESTNYMGKYSDTKAALTGKYGDIADGFYTFQYGYHGDYAAFWVENNNAVPSMILNPNRNDFFLTGVHIHKGGDGWSFSQGCITIHQNDWGRFMSYFKENQETYSYAKNKETGKLEKVYYKGNNKIGKRNDQMAGNLIISTI